ncbi:FAD-binding protein [Aliiroseovarius sp. YM-037]|uniref:FAD-binding protein n=1 Tax=Aliiroseovarius sp. YM-037 TaxID=3341728 RepID=UPI003A80245F
MRPESETELAEAVRSANGPLRLQGGGTRPIGNPVSGEVLELSGLSGITLYEPGALTMVAQAGTSLAEVQAALAAEGQRLAFEPMDHRGLLGTTGEPTIGGVVAANISGPRRVQVGACRDFLLGVRFVDGSGTVIKNGGRVMKNVTGYDLVKLLCGSYGTLGALSEVSFKVLPKVEVAGCLKLAGLTVAEAVAALSRALGSPYEVSGAAHAPAGPDGEAVTLIRLEGFADSVAYRGGKLRESLTGFGDTELDLDTGRVEALWRWVGDVEAFHLGQGDVWRISVKPSDGSEVVSRLPDAGIVMDWGGGLIWAEVAAGTDIRAKLRGVPGHATLIRADDEMRTKLGAFQPEAAPLAKISAGLRAKFDPRGILNPGLMAPVEGVSA